MKSRIFSIWLTGNNLKELAERYHFGESSLPHIKALYEAVLPLVQAEVCFALSGNTAVCAATLGRGVDDLQELYSRAGAIEEEYILDCIGGVLLEKVYKRLDEEILKETGLYPTEYAFPGAQLPIEEAGKMLKLLEGCHVSCNEAYLLKPKKSVVFQCSLAKQKESCGICAGCPKTDCMNRRIVSGGQEKNHNYSYGYQHIFGKEEQMK